jgi:molybdopterin molybdotransferase
MQSSDLSPGHRVTPSIFAKPIESQPAEITQLFFSQPLRAMQGLKPAILPFERATLADAMPPNDMREDYVRAQIEVAADGELLFRPFNIQDSSMLLTLAHSDALIRRAAFAPSVQKGEEVEVIRLDGRGENL